MDNRFITLTEGTGMGDAVIVFETNAPIERLQELEKISCDVYLNGGDCEDVPIWAEVLSNEGYCFEYVDDYRHITAYGTSKDWLEKNYKFISEHYVIDNQPEL